MAFEISFHEAFIADLTGVPKKVQNAFRKSLEFLAENADQADGRKIKKLHGFRDLWRFRLSDSYRLIYRVRRDDAHPSVTLIALGDRKDVYDRIGFGPDGPTYEIIRDAPELVDDESLQKSTDAWLAPDVEQSEVSASPDRELPLELTPDLLEQWLIPRAHREAICSAESEDELLALSGAVPDTVLLRVINKLWPPDITEIIQTPTRVADSPRDLLEAAFDGRSLSSFLLKLDEDQEAFVKRFRCSEPEGPWMLKGGPGSGKSVVALYCIREILREHSTELPGMRAQPKILLTTYTNSLINASRRLLGDLVDAGIRTDVTIETVDRIAAKLLAKRGWDLQPAGTTDNKVISAARQALNQLRRDDTSFMFNPPDLPFLLEEVDWVITGRGINSLERYLEEDRAGRGRGLNERQRRNVWEFHTKLAPALDDKGLCFFSAKQAAALESAEAEYDYAFIDEAQDLKPVAIRLVTQLCKGGKNVFITADSNQSIYGTGMRWRAVADDLQFTGRTNILKRNYRTTREIWEAVGQLAPQDEGTDAETMAVEPVYRGPWPTIHWYRRPGEWAPRLNKFVSEAMKEERVGPDSVAVLCPTSKEFAAVVGALDESYNAKSMTSRELKIAHPGVKVTTMHAAKGIEFPIVVIAGAVKGRLPWPSPDPRDTEHKLRQQRLLFVACTRAMRRLLILASSENPSPFLANVTDDLWEMEGAVPKPPQPPEIS